ncbi:MAG: hypothetical protein K9N23_08630 [Akkermansiaceae bacterium]|nr:hypothetical protein [Akkermansiaceae bacterium]MCF7731740.1 hypothetical protein [Akkermansiaceae bacterium]
MTSRKCIVAAIEPREPDPVPRDLGGTPSSGNSVIADGRINRHLGFIRSQTRGYDVVPQLAPPSGPATGLHPQRKLLAGTQPHGVMRPTII